MNKINIYPVFRDHFGTFCDSRGQRLIRDYVFFLIIPLILGAFVSSVGFRPTSAFIDFLLLAYSVFIPLIFNVLFVIYGIRERQVHSTSHLAEGAPRTKRKSTELLDSLYKNLIYATVIACITLVVLGSTKLLGLPPPKFLPEAIKALFVALYPPCEWLIYTVVFSLLVHTALTVLMIIKRTHYLLDHAIQESDH